MAKAKDGGDITLREHARAMAGKRWKQATAKDRKQVGKDLAAARAKKLSPEERSEIARNAAAGRWGKAKKK